METLLELLPRIEQLGLREAYRHTNGYRTWRWSFADLYDGILRFSAYLARRELGSGQRVVLWAGNRPEWVAVFWACLARGVQVAPLDRQSSQEFVSRIVSESGAALLVHSGTCPRFSEPIDTFAIEALGDLPTGGPLEPAPVRGSDVAQIVYTSGTTSEPKGVMHRHRNICANLDPIRLEIERYRWLAAPFQPVRILDILPLSHLFGQSMGIYVPLLLGGSAVFTTKLHPAAIRDAIRCQRVSVLACVPRILGSLQADVRRQFPDADADRESPGGPLQRWWRHRDIHRGFGLKFWAFVVGGAKLDPRAEAFWSRLGLLVIQGYGLTETSPVVAVNHPFRARRGTLGEVVGSHEVRIAADGEILVRGDSVVDEYLKDGQAVPAVDDEGWFHTGDLGALDDEGRLVFLGRKKDVIVLSDGRNVHPADIEAVLVADGQVKDAVVVGYGRSASPRVHAVLILDNPGADPWAVAERVNPRLEPHQRIQSASEWPGDEFPRTASTLKTQRGRVLKRLVSERRPPTRSGTSGLDAALLAATGRSAGHLSADHRLAEDLGMSSLERVDMLASLEDTYRVSLNEEQLARLSTVGQVRDWVASQSGRSSRDGPASTLRGPLARQGSAGPRVRPPRWARRRPVRAIRRAVRRCLVLPLFRRYIPLEVSGASALDDVTPPVLFAANHASHLDTVAVLAALPRDWRRLLAPAASQQHFFPSSGRHRLGERVGMTALYWLACSLFNAYPLSQEVGQVRDSLRYTGELVSAGFCPLVYPEGKMTPDGALQPFRPGIAALSQRLEATVVPVYLHGLYEVMSRHDSWPRPSPVGVAFGAPIASREGESYTDFAKRIEACIRSLQEGMRR